jgi:hypothetical protein
MHIPNLFRAERAFGDAVMVSGVLVNVEGKKNREVCVDLVFHLTGLEVQGSSMAGNLNPILLWTKLLQSLNSLHLGFWKTLGTAPFARQMSNWIRRVNASFTRLSNPPVLNLNYFLFVLIHSLASLILLQPLTSENRVPYSTIICQILTPHPPPYQHPHRHQKSLSSYSPRYSSAPSSPSSG